MKFIYPAIFTLEDGAYNVEFPDLEGCFTCGDTMTEAFFNAQEALSAYTASVLERGLNLPSASELTRITAPNNGLVQLVDAKPAYTQASVKKTLSIPSWLNRRAEAAHAPYSKILQEGLERYLGLAR